jgi:hypothetical protein
VSCEVASLTNFFMMLFELLRGICNGTRRWCGHCRGR